MKTNYRHLAIAATLAIIISLGLQSSSARLQKTAGATGSSPSISSQHVSWLSLANFFPVETSDIAVNKIAPNTVAPGADLSYTLQVANSGPDAAANAALNDTLPTNTTFVSVSSPVGWNCTSPSVGSGGTVTCTNPSFAVTSGVTFTLVVHVDPQTAQGTVIGNTATVSTTNTDTNGGNNTSSATTFVQATNADVSVTKTGPETVAPDTDVSYTIQVANSGPDAAANVTLNDPLPANTTFVSVLAPAGWNPCTTPSVGSGGTVNCTNASLAVTNGQTFTLVVHIAPDTPPNTFLTNIATVSTNPSDTNEENNSASATTSVPGTNADVGVSKTASTDTALAGASVTYTIVVTNAGPDPASSATLADTLPGNMTFVSLSSPAGWSCTPPSVGAGGTVNCSKPILAVSAIETFTLVGNIPIGTPAGTEYFNTALVASSTHDPNTDNNQSGATTTVATCFTNPSVTSNADSGPGSLRQTILDACPDATISFDQSVVSPIALTSGELVINKNLTIEGPGANVLTVRRSTAGGTPNFRIFNIQSGTVTISGLTISGGSADNPNFGGGISNAGSLTLTNSTVSSNATSGAGGGINNTGSLTLTNSTVSSNTSNGAGGGIFMNGGSATLTNSRVSGNNGGAGGGILNQYGTLTLESSTVSGNTGSAGGGIYNTYTGATLTLTNSTISGNTSGSIAGGIFNNYTLTLTNTTVSNNTSSTDGGGIYSFGGNQIILTNSTVSGNTSTSGNGGGMHLINFPATLKNSIVANNNAGGTGPDVNGTINSQDYNLIGNTTATNINGTTTHNITNQSANLGALSNNGGPTQTMRPLPNSPAVNAGDGGASLPPDTYDADGDGDTAEQLPVDQRGFPRVVGGKFDIGAVETNYTITATAGTPQSAAINTAFATNLQATVKESNIVQDGISVSFTAPGSGASGTFPGNVIAASATTNGSGVSTAPTFTANGTAGGPYNVTASIGTSLPTATFALTNTKGQATITLSNLNQTYDGTPKSVTATTNPAGLSGVTITYDGSTTAPTNPGSYAVVASLNNPNYQAPNATGTLVISQAATTTAVTSSANPSDFGQSVTFTATVTGPANAGTPTGTVQFKDGGNNIGAAAALNASGVATFSTSALIPGPHVITAVYSGDSNFSTSTGTLSGGQTVRPQPSLSINDVSQLEGNSGTTNFNFTVTLSVASNLTVTANYATADGTATVADNDYQAKSGVVTFAPGQTTQTITILVNGDTKPETDEAFSVNLSGAVNATISDNQGLGTLLDDDTPAVQFSSATYSIGEAGSHAAITVIRTGDSSIPVTVNYASSDASGLNTCSQVTGNASQRCDYATVVGILRFAAGQNSKDIIVPIIDDVHIEGNEIFTMTLSGPVGGNLGPNTSAVVTITDNDTGAGTNPIDNDAFFIRQLYIDLLGRLPEPGAVNSWLGILNHCSVSTDCDRIAVAQGFLGSLEFQGRGYFVYRHYSALLGRIPLYGEFTPDMALVNGFLSGTDLEANKMAYTNIVMNRPEFKSIYDPTINNPTAFVDKLIEKAGLTGHSQRSAWISGLTNSTLTRAQVVRQFIDSTEVSNKFVREAFVIMNYFGFLRRTADASYQGWINLLNQTNDPRVVIGGFINSPEYRLRFGP